MTASHTDAAGVDKQGSNDKRSKQIEILVDDEPTLLDSKDTTPNEILVAAGLDPATHYLVLLKGRNRTSYQGKGDEPIKVHEGETFVSLSTGPTPTS